jgi:hypothetical protein
MVDVARAVFIIPVADVFIRSFNDSGANKQSQIKINFATGPLGTSAHGTVRRRVIQARVAD